MRRQRAVEAKLASDRFLAESVEELEVLAELAAEDAGAESEIRSTLERIEPKLERIELETKMTGEYDASNAFVEIHPGAGGTESADWAQMLLRMYLKWCEGRGFAVDVLDVQDAEEAGIRSATLLVRAEYAYGYLKCENGIHRLVRISPFDAQGRRHTSFASVHTYPEVDEAVEVGSIINLMDLVHGKMKLIEVTLAANSPAVARNLTLDERRLPDSVRVVAVVRSEQPLNPTPTMHFLEHDHVILMARAGSAQECSDAFIG